MAVSRRDLPPYWNKNNNDSDSDDDDDDDESLIDRLKNSIKEVYNGSKEWSQYGWKKSKSFVYETCAHTFFVTLPFFIIIMQQQLEEQKWKHTLTIAKRDVNIHIHILYPYIT